MSQITLSRGSPPEDSSLALGPGPALAAEAGAPQGGFSPAMLLPYKWSILAAFVLLAGLSVAGVMASIRPMYTATARIEVLPVIPQLMQGKSDMVPLYDSYRASQVDHILGTEVLDAVLDRAEVRATAFYRDSNQPLFQRWLRRLGIGHDLPPRDRLRESLEVEAPKGKEHIYVTFAAPTPGESRIIVDAVVEEFTRFSNQRDSDADLDRMSKLRTEIRTKEGDLRQKQALVSEHRQRLKTANPEEILEKRLVRLDELKSQLAEMQRHLDVSARSATTQSVGLDTSAPGAAGPGPFGAPQSTDPALQRVFAEDHEWSVLYSELLNAQSGLRSLGDRYGDAHPAVRRLKETARLAQERLAERERTLAANYKADGVTALPGTEADDLRTAAKIDALAKYIKAEEARYRSDFKDQESLRELDAQLVDATEKLVALRNEYERIEMNRQVAGSIRPWKAYEPQDPSDDKRVKLLAAAIAGSLFASLGLAFLRVRFSPIVNNAATSLPLAAGELLGRIPAMSPDPRDRGLNAELVGESVRMLRTTLLRALGGSQKQIIQIASADQGAGKTTLCMLLGRSFAALGTRVLLVDTDFARPQLSTHWNLPENSGLLPFLKQRGELAYCTPDPSAPALSMLPAGTCDDHEHPEELASDRFKKLIDDWREKFDLVLIDGAPLMGLADAAIIAGQVDATVLVVREGRCRRAAIDSSLQILESAGGQLLGSVVVGHPMGRRGYGYGYAGLRRYYDRNAAPHREHVQAVLDGRAPRRSE